MWSLLVVLYCWRIGCSCWLVVVVIQIQSLLRPMRYQTMTIGWNNIWWAMGIIQAVAFIALVVFIIYGLWLQFRMRLDIEENEQEDNKKLHEWIKAQSQTCERIGLSQYWKRRYARRQMTLVSYIIIYNKERAKLQYGFCPFLFCYIRFLLLYFM